MIDLIYRSKAPAYKGTNPTTNGRTGLLSSFWCYLFGGGAAPGYRGKNAGGATAPTVSRCWWSLSGTPQYQRPPMPTPDDPSQEVPPENGEPTGEDCGCEPPLVTREIHVYPHE